jgi:hypothetical protein
MTRQKESESWPHRLTTLNQLLDDVMDKVTSVAGDDEVPVRHRQTLTFVASKERHAFKVVRKLEHAVAEPE